MDPIKVGIFIAFFALFLIIVKKLFSSEIPNPAHRMPEVYPEPTQESLAPPVLTGAEIPFPVAIPPRNQREDGTWNRPEIKNYFFGNNDLIRGPQDQQAFCDEFTVQFEMPEAHQAWFVQYTVATPAGMEKFLRSQQSRAVVLEHTVILLPRWDLEAVLRAVIDDVMESWSQPDSDEQQTFIDNVREMPPRA